MLLVDGRKPKRTCDERVKLHTDVKLRIAPVRQPCYPATVPPCTDDLSVLFCRTVHSEIVSVLFEARLKINIYRKDCATKDYICCKRT